MTQVDDSDIRFMPTVLEEPGAGMTLRYMKRRRIDRHDRNGDPLDGIVNLFDVAIVLAVGFLLAALTGLGMSDLLTSKDMTIVTNPGTEDMQVVVKNGDTIERLDLQQGQQASGVGTLIGSFYKLSDGTTVYVPAAGSPPAGSTPLPDTTPTPGATAPSSTDTTAPSAPPMPAPGQTGPTGATGTGTTAGSSTSTGTATPPASVPTTQPGDRRDSG